jgi:type IV secretory pathway protease TraF
MAGDEIDLDHARATVNRAPVTSEPIADRDHASRPLPHVPFGRHRVGPGEVWLVGLPHAASWDSRYFGPVPVSGVRSVVAPLLVLGEGGR